MDIPLHLLRTPVRSSWGEAYGAFGPRCSLLDGRKDSLRISDKRPPQESYAGSASAPGAGSRDRASS